MKKICLISLNSPVENTGGGIYLRTLLSVFCKIGQVTLIAKGNKTDNRETLSRFELHKLFLFKKNVAADLISRVILQPSFLGAYIFKILLVASQNDIVVLHNARNGFIAFLIKFFLRKKVVLCSDNIEIDILKTTHSASFFKRVIRGADMVLLFYVERLAYRVPDVVTFITEHDLQRASVDFCKGYKPSYIVLPVLLALENKTKSFKFKNKSGVFTVLFTASFDFEPNILALNFFLNIANSFSSNRDFQFVLAGRGLDAFVDKLSSFNNVSYYSNLSSVDMERVFCEADIYLSPVTSGSGMKTKVAEALSYGLPVIATSHSLIGYEAVHHSDFIVNADDLDSFGVALASACSLSPNLYQLLRKQAFDSFLETYCTDGESVYLEIKVLLGLS